MLTKLLTLVSTAKGAAAATVVAAAAVGTGVAATNPDVQSALTNTVLNITQGADAKSSNQPAIVAARNDADKKLRDAFQDDQQKLAKLHSTHVDSTDRAKLNDTVNTADAALRARLTKALNDVATLTLGREGLESPKPIGSPDVKASFTTVAQAKVDDTVATAINDMVTIEADAETAVGALPIVTPGKPADAGKPADPGKPANAPASPSHP